MPLSLGPYKNAPVQNNQTGVRTQHADYRAFTDKWQKCRDCEAGEDAMKMAGQQYVPKLRDQDNNDYVAYITRGSFYNATARTIEGLLGMMFRKPPIGELPAGIEDFLKNVDMCGQPIDVFAANIAEQCLDIGRVGVLVDYTPAVTVEGAPLTVAMTEKANLRPMMKIYLGENIINWRFKQINNNWTLCQVVLSEQYSEPAIDPISKLPSEFANQVETRYRVLDLEDDLTYRVRVFRIDEQDHDQLVSTVYPLMNGNPLGFIPFVCMSNQGMGFDCVDPPMLDLINVNIAHWRSSVDFEHGAHYTALPTLFINNFQQVMPENGEAPAKIYLGSQSAITTTGNAEAKFIEFTGGGLSTIENSMDRKEQQMAILGARMLATEGKQAQTTTTTAIHRTGENSALSKIAISISLGLTTLLNIFSKWAGYADTCNYAINRDFLPVPIDGPTLTAIMLAYQKAAINEEELFDWLQRGDIIEAEVTLAEHKAGTFVEQPPVLDPNAAPPIPPNVGKPVANVKVPSNKE